MVRTYLPIIRVQFCLRVKTITEIKFYGKNSSSYLPKKTNFSYKRHCFIFPCLICTQAEVCHILKHISVSQIAQRYPNEWDRSQTALLQNPELQGHMSSQ